MHTRIIGLGAYLPQQVVPNEAFNGHTFLLPSGAPVPKAAPAIVDKFEAITEIAERRYARSPLCTSDLAAEAARLAIEQAGIDADQLE